MNKKVIELKWKAYKGSTDPAYDFWHVETFGGIKICTCYSDEGGVIAKQIASDHNAQLKANRALKRTPFGTSKKQIKAVKS